MVKSIIKNAILVVVMSTLLGCTQVTRGIDNFGEGVVNSVESRNEGRSSSHQDRSPNSEDVTFGILNLIFESVVSLFSEEED